jgi:hypothetical protein
MTFEVTIENDGFWNVDLVDEGGQFIRCAETDEKTVIKEFIDLDDEKLLVKGGTLFYKSEDVLCEV